MPENTKFLIWNHCCPIFEIGGSGKWEKRWKRDLNTTIKHLYVDKEIGEGDEESLSEYTKSSQTHQMIASAIGASSSEKQVGQSKPNQIANTRKQETHEFPSQFYDREKNEQASSGLTILEESQDSKTQSSRNLFKQAIAAANNKESLTKGTQEMGENIERPLVEAAKIALNPTGIYDAAIGTQEIHDTMNKSLMQTNQYAEKLATTQNTESHDSYSETQNICDAIKKPSISVTQNIPNSTMILKAAIDPSPSQDPEPMTSSIQKSNIYKNYKGMIDIPEQNMPYLEAGVKRHPQVLHWLYTKHQRVFASAFFSLFSEVTRILRTTRGIDLTEDDQNYIRECCVALQVVGFDDSWINYVHGCIEECEGGEDIEKKVEEAEDQASNLKAQLESMKKELASVEESLVLLRHKATRLHNFIES